MYSVLRHAAVLLPVLIGLCFHGDACAGELPRPMRVRIDLPEKAQVAPGPLRLSHLASVDVEDPLLRQLIESAPIGQAPMLNQTLRMNRSGLAVRVRRAAPHAALEIDWAGAYAVDVQTAGAVLPADRFVAAAKDALAAYYEGLGEVARLTPLQAPADLAVPPGELILKARPLQGTPLRARVAVWVDVLVNGNLYRSVVVPIQVAAERETLVARHAMPAGVLVLPEHFTVAKQDVAVLGGSAVAPPALRPGQRLAHSIKEGQVLMQRQISESNAVMRGDQVRLLVRDAALSIESSAVAQADAGLGQYLLVKPAYSTASVNARVLAAGVVELGPESTRR